MGFGDILKKSFIQGYMDVNLTSKSIILILVTTAIFALYLFVVYRIVNRKSIYSRSFNISLVAMSIITAAIIISIQTSVVISLGMVGALSIVRFRTAIKDPMDLIFLFWSIGVGIMCGAGQFELTGIMCVGLTVLILILESIPMVKAPMVLVLNLNRNISEEIVEAILKDLCKIYRIKSRSIKNSVKEMVIELKTSQESELMDRLSDMEGINSVSLLAHSGEVTY